MTRYCIHNSELICLWDCATICMIQKLSNQTRYVKSPEQIKKEMEEVDHSLTYGE